MPTPRIPYVRRIGRGVMEVDERDQPKPLSNEEKKLVNRIIAANNLSAASRLLSYIRKRCNEGKLNKRGCGGCPGSKKSGKAKA